MITFRNTLFGAALIGLLALAGTVGAEEAPPPALFSPYFVTPQADSAVVRDQQVVRALPVQIDRQQLLTPLNASERTPQQSILLNLFDDAQFVAELDRVEHTALRSVSWIGHLRGIEHSQVVIVLSDGVVSGNITMPQARYHIRFMGNGVHEVQKIDTSLFPEDEAYVPVPDIAKQSLLPATTSGGAPDDGSIIDVMVVYTATTRAAAGGTSAMQTLIDLAVSETNQSYLNSGITQRIRLVHSVEVAYSETGTDPLGDALNCITSTSDGCIDNIHALRDTYGADLVSFWLENGGGYCGLGWMQSTVSASFASSGFNTVARSCATGYYSFGHELGHNMGARHDVYVDTATTPYAYAHGYTYPSAASPWRTVMAYNDACAKVGKNCTRIQYWSNPSLTYGGVALGNSTADNRSTLNNTAYTVANFRSSAGASTYSLSVNSSGTSSVSISASPSTYAGTTNYSKASIVAGTSITLTAPSTSGSTSFSSWSGCDSTSGANCTVTMNSNKSVTVTYASSGGGTNIVQNPGFESGVASWTQTSSAGYTLIGNYAPPTASFAPHGGSYQAWLGGYNSGTDSIEQTLTIPSSASSAKLEFWYAIATTETGGSASDFLQVELYSSSGTRLSTLATLSNLSTTSAWTKSTAYDVSAYKGQTVRLRFTATTNATNWTSFYIDDISLTTSSSGRKKGITPLLMLLLE